MQPVGQSLTHDETTVIITGLVHQFGSMSPDEIHTRVMAIDRWITQTRLDYAVIESLLLGLITVDIAGERDDWVYSPLPQEVRARMIRDGLIEPAGAPDADDLEITWQEREKPDDAITGTNGDVTTHSEGDNSISNR